MDNQDESVQNVQEGAGVGLDQRDANQGANVPAQVAGSAEVSVGNPEGQHSGPMDLPGALSPAPVDATAGKSPQDFIKSASMTVWDYDLIRPAGIHIFRDEESTGKFLDALLNNKHLLVATKYKDAFVLEFHKLVEPAYMPPAGEYKMDKHELQFFAQALGREVTEKEFEDSGAAEYFKKNPVQIVRTDMGPGFYVYFADLDDPFLKETEDVYEVIVGIMHQLKLKVAPENPS
jgi:hypothetical protein